MTDIVDRLLDTTDRDRIDDAIHEIIALRAEIEQLRAQVTQLLDIVANWKDTGADAIAVMNRLLEDRNKLLAENEQLRAALYDIEQEALSYNHYGYAEKAQEALNKNEDDEALKEGGDE